MPPAVNEKEGEIMKNLKRLTMLHSNDMHGDFLAEEGEGKLVGGVSMLSGYIQKVRSEEKNVLYVISGDMLRGSVIDSEFKGLSTIEIMNMLTPDVATLGNHEIDYGIGHLLFLEKCARFPIVNANMYLTINQMRMFNGHIILEIDGIKVLFIGVLTEEVLSTARKERLIGSFINVHEAAAEVGRICNAHRTEDVDITVLLTHIGFEEDKKLAELLDPRWGIDLIIGGHSHTRLEEPCIVAGIPIVQAVMGTDQIGRFDLLIDTDTNSIDSYTWQLIPIDDSHCPRDIALEKLVETYSAAAEEKYSRYITRFAGVYTHPARNRETQLGRLMADVLRDNLGLDIMLLGSGSIRVPELGPLVTLKELTEMFPFQEEILQITVTGRQLKNMFNHIFRPGALEDDHAELYQFSRDLRVVVSMAEQKVTELSYNGEPVDDSRMFRVGLQTYHYKSMEEFLGISEAEAEKNAPVKTLATSAIDVLDENLSRMELVVCPNDERWITVEN